MTNHETRAPNIPVITLKYNYNADTNTTFDFEPLEKNCTLNIVLAKLSRVHLINNIRTTRVYMRVARTHDSRNTCDSLENGHVGRENTYILELALK